LEKLMRERRKRLRQASADFNEARSEATHWRLGAEKAEGFLGVGENLKRGHSLAERLRAIENSIIPLSIDYQGGEEGKLWSEMLANARAELSHVDNLKQRLSRRQKTVLLSLGALAIGLGVVIVLFSSP
jgi:hypothetical protein